MPIYEFKCNVCGAPFSIFVRSMGADVDARCEKCGSVDLSRAISSFAVIRGSDPGSDLGFDPADPGMASMMGGMPGMGGMDGFGDDF